MKRIIYSLLTTLVLTTTAYAGQLDCMSSLTQEYRNDNVHMTVSLDDNDIRDYGKDHLARAIAVVRIALKKRGCAKKDVNFGKGPLGRSKSRCRHLVANVPTSLACYVETNLGYFVLSYDMLDVARISYHRWD